MHLNFSQSGIEHAEKEFANGRRAPHRGHIWTQHHSIGYVEINQIVQLFVVTSQRPIVGELTDRGFAPGQRRSSRRRARPGIARRGSTRWPLLRAGQNAASFGGREIVMMIMMMIVVLPSRGGGCFQIRGSWGFRLKGWGILLGNAADGAEAVLRGILAAAGEASTSLGGFGGGAGGGVRVYLRSQSLHRLQRGGN